MISSTAPQLALENRSGFANDQSVLVSTPPRARSSRFSAAIETISGHPLPETDVPRAATAATNLADLDPRAQALASRIAGRAVAAQMSDEEIEARFAERERLIRKKLDGNIARSEERRLQLVRWELDRVEDALHGRDLDRLEMLVLNQEALEQAIRELTEGLSSASRRQRRR